MSIDAAQMAALAGMYENAGALQQREIENRYKLGRDQIANAYKIAKMESGDRRAALEATREYQRGQLEMARRELEELGIPRVQIERYVAEKNYEIAQGELAYKREALAEDIRQYEKTYGLQEGALTGYLNGLPTLAREQWMASHGLAEAGVTGYYGEKPTLEREQMGLEEAERQRRYALDVAQYGTELASQPDRYFQARRFQAMEAPRLLGGAGAGGAAPEGGPTPQIQTMGALLSGQDPATVMRESAAGVSGAQYGGPAASTGGWTRDDQGQPVWTPGGGTPRPGGPVIGSTDPRLAASGGGETGDERYKQIAQIAKASPPSPYDGLDEQDAATLKLMENVYKKGGQAIAGGEWERMGKAGQGFIGSAGRLLGYDPADLERTYQAYRPAQGSSRLA
jgi:hypothetical protein